MTLFPESVFYFYKSNKIVNNVLTHLYHYIKQYNIDLHDNNIILSINKLLLKPINIKYIEFLPKYENKILIIYHNNYKKLNKNISKIELKNNFDIINQNNIYHYFLNDDFNGLYLNSIIDYICNKYDITNIFFYNINYDYNIQLLNKYLFTNIKNILFLDDYKKFSYSFIISYQLFKFKKGFDNLFDNIQLFYIFFMNFYDYYKTNFNVLYNNNNNNKIDNIKIDYKNFIGHSKLNHIYYKIKFEDNYNQNIKISFSELKLNHTYITNELLIKPYIYTIFPYDTSNKKKNNSISNNNINNLRKNSIYRGLEHIETQYYKNNNYNIIIYILLNYIQLNYKYDNPKIFYNYNFEGHKIINTIQKFYKNHQLYYKNDFNKNNNIKFDIILNNINVFEDGHTNYNLELINHYIDNNLNINGFITLQFYNIPKKNDIILLLDIFRKFEKIILLKVNTYSGHNTNCNFLCINKLKKYYTNIYSKSLYSALNHSLINKRIFEKFIYNLYEKYSNELDIVKKYTNDDNYIFNLWLNYGFTLNNKFYDLDSNINLYEGLFINLMIKIYLDKYFKDKKINILEVGLAYGTSSIMILNRFINFKYPVHYTIIDPNQTQQWKSIGVEHIHQYIKLKNIKNITIDLNEQFSQDILPKLKYKYNIIFIDGSHDEHIVYLDLVNSYNLLVKNGIIIADDVRHSGVKLALERFYKDYKGKLNRIFRNDNDTYISKNMNVQIKSEKYDFNNPNTMFAFQKIK